MKTVFLVATCLFFAMNLSAQRLARKSHNNKVDNTILVSTNKDFRTYVATANERLNEINTSLQKLEFLSKHEVQTDKIFDAKVKSLEKEIAELNKDLKNFIQYGIGDWRLFRNEFNNDLTSILRDIQALESESEPADLIVGR